jgi:hypothetical protein
MSTPIYDTVAADLGWSPDDLRPTYDLEGAAAAAAELAREQITEVAADAR